MSLCILTRLLGLENSTLFQLSCFVRRLNQTSLRAQSWYGSKQEPDLLSRWESTSAANLPHSSLGKASVPRHFGIGGVDPVHLLGEPSREGVAPILTTG